MVNVNGYVDEYVHVRSMCCQCGRGGRVGQYQRVGKNRHARHRPYMFRLLPNILSKTNFPATAERTSQMRRPITRQELLDIIEKATRTGQAVLNLRSKGIRQLPDTIGQLSNLQSLYLDNNQLTGLPDVIGQLSNLQWLYLDNNQLTGLPDVIGQLSNLQSLYLMNNQLTGLPDVIGQLSNLQSLHLSDNELTELPDVIGQLSNLQSLHLMNNRLTGLPDIIGQLSNLQSLYLFDNELTGLPDTIGQLSNLQSLHLMNNRLMGLPDLISQLSNLRKLDLDGNPLNPALQSAYNAGFDTLMAYLRSLHEAEPLYEAKLVLVGEGNVGKTTLLKALMGKDTCRDEPTTHGVSIDIEALHLPHPELNNTTIQFNAWDFGGQEVYRVTHQFFFSPRAIYLLLWEPRRGVLQCQVEDWLKMIRLRVGAEARVIIVSTHCRTGGRIARIDQPVLKRDFGEMIVGFHEVDSLVVDTQTGEMVGIVELKEKIADAAKDLPQMGMKFNRHWREARDELMALGEKKPLITYAQFNHICKTNSLDAIATRTLAILMHDLGYIVYYGDDERLKEDVVLQPEWLTKAIGFVLEDRMTQEMAGILPDERLHEVWLDHSFDHEPRYEPHLYPFFLRLMEKYDVSYRLESKENKKTSDASLVAQHVPQVRPTLPWLPHEAPQKTHRRLTMICKMEESPPGLVPWMIVRTHEYSYEWQAKVKGVMTRLHWQKGMFLRNTTHGTALLELRERDFFIHVEAVWPEYFMNVLETTLQQLILDNWPGLKDRYTFRVPCQDHYKGAPCTGSFSIDALRDYLDEGDITIRCERCRRRQDIVSLLYGWEDQNEREQLQRIESKLDRVGTTMQQEFSHISTHLTELESRVANSFWSLMHAIASEAKHGPRLYTIRAVDNALWRIGFKRRCELHLWCEAEGEQHPVFERGKGVYPIEMNREWLNNVAPYLNFAYRVLKPAAFLATPALNSVFGEEFIKSQGIGAQLELADRTLQTLPAGTPQPNAPSTRSSVISAIERTGLLTLHHFLKEQDPTHAHLGLQRVPTYTGDYRWLCRHHYEAAQSKIPDKIG